TYASDFGDKITQIEAVVSTIEAELQDASSPEYLESSFSVVDALLKHAVRPMVSRLDFSRLGELRLASKHPPGFADAKTKTYALGDF
ncbi:hypothetical protein RSW32_25500, partial [Escherichia coli]|uniref:hypothetical protein n=1 Tax=Escherichia coli TaxID=562 RepID=UPI0028DE2E9C